MHGARVTGLGQVGAFHAPEVAPNSHPGNYGDIAIGPQGQVMVAYQIPQSTEVKGRPRHHRFYPWFHKLPNVASGPCGWGLGNKIPGQLDNYGGMTGAWGVLETTDYGGGFVAAENFATRVLPNGCP